jgi:hypothetical protein
MRLACGYKTPFDQLGICFPAYLLCHYHIRNHMLDLARAPVSVTAEMAQYNQVL